MKWTSFLLTLGCVFVAHFSAHATDPVSFRQPHPLSWMHSLPTGEMPGWSAPWWFNFETQLANVWNAPLTMTDKRNGKEYKYFADFEQNSTIIEFGTAFWERLGVGVEIPYAYRGEGFLDNFIDQFHQSIDNRRFNREYYPDFQSVYSVKTDGEEYYTEQKRLNGVSNVNLKLKWWLVKWMGDQEGSCPCGVSIATRTKFPVQDKSFAGTTGEIDQSYLLHIGIPLFSASAAWITAAYTALGDQPAMADWPRNDGITMYELNFDFAVGETWGLVMGGRAESPFLKRKYLDYFDTSTDPLIIAQNRSASGWNSLVRWRGSSSIGIRYRTMAGNQWQVMIAEDWGMGPYDSTDGLYSNGAPDVNLILQTRFDF